MDIKLSTGLPYFFIEEALYLLIRRRRSFNATTDNSKACPYMVCFRSINKKNVGTGGNAASLLHSPTSSHIVIKVWMLKEE